MSGYGIFGREYSVHASPPSVCLRTSPGRYMYVLVLTEQSSQVHTASGQSPLVSVPCAFCFWMDVLRTPDVHQCTIHAQNIFYAPTARPQGVQRSKSIAFEQTSNDDRSNMQHAPLNDSS